MPCIQAQKDMERLAEIRAKREVRCVSVFWNDFHFSTCTTECSIQAAAEAKKAGDTANERAQAQAAAFHAKNAGTTKQGKK